MDWPSTPIQIAAIRDVLRGRARRAEEAADAFASAHRDPPAAWHARVIASIADLRQSWGRDAAQRLVQAWDDGRPHWAPPATVALAPWAAPAPQPVWSIEEIRDRVEVLRQSSQLPIARAADLAERWSRQSGPAAREWHAAATALLRWAARATPAPPSRMNWWPVLVLLGVFVWRQRR